MKRIILATCVGLIVLISAILIRLCFSSVSGEQVVVIEKGGNASVVANYLEERGVVRSSNVLKIALRLNRGHNNIVPGEYLFKENTSVFGVADQISSGRFEMIQKKATIPEGSTNVQVAEAIKAAYPSFDDSAFLIEAYDMQGYLFPDTYYLLSTTSNEIVEILKSHFKDKTEELRKEADAQGKDWHDVVIMASILEEEADTPEDFAIVSGILWKRLDIGMGLQVDVAPETYERRGLPAEPLSNPGLETLTAALNPTESQYLYYLTGKDGLMHYAETFEKHKANVQKYLR